MLQLCTHLQAQFRTSVTTCLMLLGLIHLLTYEIAYRAGWGQYINYKSIRWTCCVYADQRYSVSELVDESSKSLQGSSLLPSSVKDLNDKHMHLRLWNQHWQINSSRFVIVSVNVSPQQYT